MTDAATSDRARTITITTRSRTEGGGDERPRWRTHESSPSPIPLDYLPRRLILLPSTFQDKQISNTSNTTTPASYVQPPPNEGSPQIVRPPPLPRPPFRRVRHMASNSHYCASVIRSCSSLLFSFLSPEVLATYPPPPGLAVPARTRTWRRRPARET